MQLSQPFVSLSPSSSTSSKPKTISTLLSHHFTQLYALTLKNALLLLRSPRTTLFLVLSPALAVLLLYAASSYSSSISSSAAVPTGAFSSPFSKCQVLDVFGNVRTNQHCYSLGYSPINNFTTNIMQTLTREFNLDINEDLIGFESDDELFTAISSSLGSIDVAIVFQSQHPHVIMGDVKGNQARYIIMYNQSSYGDSIPYFSPYGSDSSYIASNHAYQRILTLQYKLESTLVNAITANISAHYPLPTYKGPVPLTSGDSQFDIQIIPQLPYSSNYNYYQPIISQNTDPVTFLAGGTVMVAVVVILVLIIMMFIAQEKQEKIIASIRMNGLNESNYWWSYLLVFTMTSMLAAIIATSVGKMTGLQIYAHVDFSIHFIALWLFLISMCALAVMFATLVTQTRWTNLLLFFVLGVAVSSVSVFAAIGNINYMFIPINPILTMLINACPFIQYGKIWNDMSIHSSILPVSNSSIAISIPNPNQRWPTATSGYTIYVQQYMSWNDIYNQEMIPPQFANGCNWFDYTCCNWNSQITSNSNYFGTTCYLNIQSSSTSMVSMLVMTLIYMMIAWWLAQVSEKTLGGNKPFFFCFHPSYYGFKPKRESALDGDTFRKEQQKSLLDGSIRTVKISKAFKDQTAVKELSIVMEKNQCFVLLGSNGAGKTTVINMLTGLFPPTFGEAFIMGHDIKEDMSRIQSLMGICTQEDLLWPTLSVLEHMYVFAALRGVPWHDQARVCQDKLNLVNLWADRFKFTAELSGGMKRRLSIAMAMVGDPSIVFLDEPSTGMDPLHKQEVWGAINQIKKNRVVVLTTHSMEEANYLADKIAILSLGRLRALGSSLFLKNTYGKGYQLKLTVHPTHITQIEEAVRKYLIGAEVVGTEGGSITIGLRRSQLKNVPLLFQFIEKEQKQHDYQIFNTNSSSVHSPVDVVNVESHSSDNEMLKEWSISNSTLEEVFLRLCAREKAPNEEIEGDQLIKERESAMENEIEGMCGICKIRPVALVTVYTATGHELLLPNLICQQCGVGPRLTDGKSTSNLSLAVPPAVPVLPSVEEEKKDDASAPIEWSLFPQTNPITTLQDNSIYPSISPLGAVPENLPSDSIANIQDSVGNKVPTALSQILAIIKKNASIARTEKSGWIVRVLFLVLLNFLLVYFIYTFNTGAVYCPDGSPFSWSNCDLNVIKQTLFTIPPINTTGYDLTFAINVYDSLSYNSQNNQYYYTSSFNSSTFGGGYYPVLYPTWVIINNQNVLQYSISYTDSNQIGDTKFQNFDIGSGIGSVNSYLKFSNWTDKNNAIPDIVLENQNFVQSNYQLYKNTLVPSECKGNNFQYFYYLNSSDYGASAQYIRTIYPDIAFSFKSTKVATGDNPTSSLGYRLYTYIFDYTLRLPGVADINVNSMCDQNYPDTTRVSRNIPFTMHKLHNSLLYTNIRSSSTYAQNRSSANLFQSADSPGIFGNVYRIPTIPFISSLSSNGYVSGVAILICLLAILLPYICDRILYEKEENLFHMQRISGIKDVNYWSANYIYDSIMMFIWSGIILIVGYGFGTSLFTHASPLLYIILIIIWNHAQISCAWLFAYIFSSRRIASIVLYVTIFLFIGLGVVLQITSFSTYFLIFPPYAFVLALSIIVNQGGTVAALAIGTPLSNALLMCLVMSTLIILLSLYLHTARYAGWLYFLAWFENTESIKPENVNSNNLNEQLLAGKNIQLDSYDEEDEDVKAERERIESQASTGNFSTIYIRALTKQYAVRGVIQAKLKEWIMGRENNKSEDMIGGGKSYVNAVDGIWMGVENGTCFGLLG